MAPSKPDEFDGYRKWLGIANKKRPPTHYELLAISLDEDDPEVIRAAAEQRRHYVETKRGEGHDSVVNEILYRIGEAEATLLNGEMRRDYDRQLNLFEKRRKSRQVDPYAPRSQVKSQPGRTVGEDSGIVSTFAGIMAVLCVGFGVMAWFSFQLPWNKPAKQVEVAQSNPPQPVVVQVSIQPEMQPPVAQKQVFQPQLDPSAAIPVPEMVSKPIAETESPSGRTADKTYLVTLPRIGLPSHPNNWWSDKGELVLEGINGKPYLRKPLVFDSNPSPHGIYMHGLASSNVFIKYQLDGRFEMLESTAFIPEMLAEQGDPRAPLVFSVVGDGKTLWQSKALSRKGEHEPCVVSINGVNELSLKIECQGRDNWALGAWIEPQVCGTGLKPSVVTPDREVAEWVLSKGGKVKVSQNGNVTSEIQAKAGLPLGYFNVAEVDLKDLRNFGDHDLRRLNALRNVTALTVMGTLVTDAGLRELSEVTTLTSLNVAGTSVNGSGFQHLEKLKKLEVLLCGGAQINDAGLVHLKKFSNLRLLGLIDTQISDAGMLALSSITALAELRLTGCRITDKGLKKLTALKSLEKLTLNRTGVSKKGIATIRAALPRCEVLAD